MPHRLLVTTLFLMVALLSTTPAAEPTGDAESACHGVAIALFERRFPGHVRRYAFGPAMVGPFIELWRAELRPDLPSSPEQVTIYAESGQPLVIGYQKGDCVMALLSVERQRLWQWLRPRIGWLV